MFDSFQEVIEELDSKFGKNKELDYVHDMNRNIVILPMTESESMYGNFEEFTIHGFVVIGYEDVLGDFVGGGIGDWTVFDCRL